MTCRFVVTGHSAVQGCMHDESVQKQEAGCAAHASQLQGLGGDRCAVSPHPLHNSTGCRGAADYRCDDTYAFTSQADAVTGGCTCNRRQACATHADRSGKMGVSHPIPGGAGQQPAGRAAHRRRPAGRPCCVHNRIQGAVHCTRTRRKWRRGHVALCTRTTDRAGKLPGAGVLLGQWAGHGTAARPG